MADFDIQQFEHCVTDLIDTCQSLAADNRRLRKEYESLSRQNAEVQQRLQTVIQRLRALENEAAAQQS